MACEFRPSGQDICLYLRKVLWNNCASQIVQLYMHHFQQIVWCRTPTATLFSFNNIRFGCYRPKKHDDLYSVEWLRKVVAWHCFTWSLHVAFHIICDKVSLFIVETFLQEWTHQKCKNHLLHHRTPLVSWLKWIFKERRLIVMFMHCPFDGRLISDYFKWGIPQQPINWLWHPSHLFIP